MNINLEPKIKIIKVADRPERPLFCNDRLIRSSRHPGDQLDRRFGLSDALICKPVPMANANRHFPDNCCEHGHSASRTIGRIGRRDHPSKYVSCFNNSSISSATLTSQIVLPGCFSQSCSVAFPNITNFPSLETSCTHCVHIRAFFKIHRIPCTSRFL
jgi:hypothetical protein